ncbi:hypothetical protein T265_00913 [Opisthorchis viverrini]|uniref:Uncharacterized protein n=1 Tax=Opisthorchis viverrini TaxID=6198 RepID=A0A075A4N9_OPIVI|nr:hypothetical protein T265_00913 [Opisthorchis viverrini]KER33227.1 hypothetical protein T265_00913 [Opisthorchis viverrini]
MKSGIKWNIRLTETRGLRPPDEPEEGHGWLFPVGIVSIVLDPRMPGKARQSDSLQLSYFLRVTWQLGTERVLQLNDHSANTDSVYQWRYDNKSFKLKETAHTDFDMEVTLEKYTHLQINLAFARDSTEFLLYDILQLNVLHTGCTTHKVAENSSTALDLSMQFPT